VNRFVFVVLVAGALASGAWADGHSASGDASAGEVAFNKQCVACHVVVTDAGEKLAGRNSKSGPNLYNIAGATAGAVPGYRYGKSLAQAGAELGLIWTEETFSAYVQDPMDFLKVFLDDKGARAKMSFKVRKEEDARNIYAYLYSIGSK
jgi:cytochrome c